MPISSRSVLDVGGAGWVQPSPPTVQPPTSSKQLIIGLDLGQAEDSTAIVVSEIGGTRELPTHHFIEMHRAPLGTPYPTIVETTASRIAQLTARGFAVSLVVDATGPGRPVVDMFDRVLSCELVALTITGGDSHSKDIDRPGRHTARVPKNELLTATVMALEDGRISISLDHPEAETFRSELRNVEIQTSRAGRESFTHRSGTHDDLVLAGACAVWWAQYQPPPASPEFVAYGSADSPARHIRRTDRGIGTGRTHGHR